MKFFLFFIFLFSINKKCTAQTKILKGTVYNEKGMPLRAASIILFRNGKRSSSVGTSTDKDGKFSFKIPVNNADSILCTYVGYAFQFENISGNDSINITLKLKKNKELIFLKEEEEKTTFVRRTWGVPTAKQKKKYDKEKKERQKQEKLQNEINGIPIKQPIEEDAIFVKVEIEAQYPFGEKGLRKYFENALIYPNRDTLKSAEGIVVVGFTIDKNGNAINFKIIKSVNIFANEAVLNALKKMRSWSPAIQNGNTVEQYFEYSFEFKIKHTVIIQNDGKPYE